MKHFIPPALAAFAILLGCDSAEPVSSPAEPSRAADAIPLYEAYSERNYTRVLELLASMDPQVGSAEALLLAGFFHVDLGNLEIARRLIGAATERAKKAYLESKSAWDGAVCARAIIAFRQVRIRTEVVAESDDKASVLDLIPLLHDLPDGSLLDEFGDLQLLKTATRDFDIEKVKRLSAQEFFDAVKVLDESVVDAMSDSAFACYLVARKGDPRDAVLAILDRGLAKRPKSALLESVRLDIATLCDIGNPGRREKGFKDISRFIAEHPGDLPSYTVLARLYESAGDLQSCANISSKALSLYPEFALARYNRGTALFNMGKFEAALEDLYVAERLNPYDCRILGNIGSCLGASGKVRESVAYFDRAIKAFMWCDVSAADKSHSLANKARALATFGRGGEALMLIEEAIELNPTELRFRAVRSDILASF